MVGYGRNTLQPLHEHRAAARGMPFGGGGGVQATSPALRFGSTVRLALHSPPTVV